MHKTERLLSVIKYNEQLKYQIKCSCLTVRSVAR